MQHAEHRVIFAEYAADGCSGMDAQGVEFAEQKESKDVVEISVGERDTGDGRMASLPRM
jgi:hypothetical protein